MVWLFQDMKGDARSRHPPKCFKAVAAASPHVETANTVWFLLLFLWLCSGQHKILQIADKNCWEIENRVGLINL